MSAGTDLGLRAIFDTLVVASALARGRAAPTEHPVDTRGFVGAVDFEFTGEGGGTWHCAFDEQARVRFHRGAHPAARATLSISAGDFFKVLRGDTSYMVAQMTGRARIRGDGHAGLMFGGLIAQLQNLRKARGLPGRALGLVIDRAIERSRRRYP